MDRHRNAPVFLSLDSETPMWYRMASPILPRAQKATPGRMKSSNRHDHNWKQLLDSAPCGLVLLDRHTMIDFLNLAAARLLGVDQRQATGQMLTSVVPAWKETPFCVSLPGLLGAQSLFKKGVDFDVPGPDKKSLRISGVLVPGDAEETRGLLLSLVETTEIATLERRLHRAEHQAAIGKLARGIAHELNSPLDGVLRYTHLALEHLTDDSPVREYLIHVKEGLDRMVRAVRAFLEFSRQVTTPVNRLANLNQLVEDALLLVHHRAKFQQIRVVRNLEELLPAVMDGGLQHAIVNLIKNAFDAMPRGGTLTITTRTSGRHVDVEVEDTGAGIPEEIRPRIFEPFFSTKPIHQGSGLGLIIAKEVIDRSGGSIEFESRVGVGSTFRLHVPVAPAETRGENGA